MKAYLTLLILLLTATLAFAANIGDDSVNLGDGNNASTDKAIIFNDGTPAASRKKISIDGTTKNLKSNSNVFELGDNTAGTKSIKLNRGGTNPEIKWNETLSRWEFSSDGTLYKAFGSGSGSGDGGVNLIGNSGFEDGVTLEWTNVGGTFTQQTYATPTDTNSKFARFVASAAGQYFETTAKVIPSFLGVGCMADIKYFTATNQAFKIQAIDGSANILAEQTLAVTTSILRSPTITFPCPAVAATVKLRVISLLAATIDSDDGYIGGNKNLVESSQAKFLGSINFSGACTWSSGSLSYADFTPDADCVYTTAGAALAPLTNLPAIRFPKMEKGSYVFIYTGSLASNRQAGAGAAVRFRITDGITSSFEEHHIGGATATDNAFIVNGTGSWSINLPASQGETTFKLQGLTSLAASSLASIGVPYSGGPVTQSLKVYFYPDSSSTAVTSDQSGWFIDANIGGANPSLGTVAISSYTEITDAGLDLVLNSGSASARIPCSATNAPTGLTCAVGNESLGVNFTPPYAGYFDVCGSFSYSMDTAANNSNNTAFQFIETPSNAQTILQEGKERTSVAQQGASNFLQNKNIKNCGTFYFSSTSERTIRLAYEQLGTFVSSVILGDRNGTIGQRDVRITVRPSTMNIARPVLTGDQVVTPNALSPVVFSGYINTATGAVSNIKGGYLPNTCTISPVSGSANCTFTSPLSSAPNCVLVGQKADDNVNDSLSCDINSSGIPSSTQLRVITHQGPARSGNLCFVLCHGEK